MDYKKAAEAIVEHVGGKENITSVMHCVTRVRVRVADDSKVDGEALKKIDGVLGYVHQGGQHQVVIGPKVNNVYDEVIAITGDQKQGGTVAADPRETAADTEKASILTKLLDTISGIFVPILPALVGAGMLQALLSLLSFFNIVNSGSETYQIINFFGKGAYYFLPIILAHSAGKKLGCNPYVSMALAAGLCYPNLATLLSNAKTAGEVVHFFGLPVTAVTYTQSVFPILLTVWAQKYIEKGVTKVIPHVLKSVFVPMITMVICVPLALVVLGPLGTFLGEGLLQVIKFLQSVAPWLAPMVVGLICPLVIMTGMHFASFIPMTTMMLASTGFDNVCGVGMVGSNFAVMGACLAVAVLTKDSEMKSTATASGIEAVMGVSEPALFGVCVKYKTPLIASCLGAGVAGLLGGIFNVGRYAQAGTSCFALTSFIGGDSLRCFYMMVVFALIAAVVGFVATLVLKIKEKA